MLIGLCGAAGSGKDTVAGVLADTRGFISMAFADPLYRAVSEITGLSVEQLHDRDVKERPISWLGRSPRYLLQTLGTEWGRGMVNEGLWVQSAMMRAKKLMDDGEDVVITDVRFDNEASAIRGQGGVVWQVVRPGWQCLDKTTSQHQSEGGVSYDLIDSFVLNNGTLDHLRETALAAIIDK